MLKSVTDPFQHGATPVGSRPAGRWYRRRLYAALGSGALLAGALGYIGLVDPHNPDSVFPVCPFRLLTGWNCPACGALRMTHDVLHGDLAAAINDNVLLLVGIPVLAGWISAAPPPRKVAVDDSGGGDRRDHDAGVDSRAQPAGIPVGSDAAHPLARCPIRN